MKKQEEKSVISKELIERVREKIIQTRVNMLLTHPFFGTLAMRLQLCSADEWLKTMAVDGKYLYYNHKFVDGLTVDELLFVFSHEILHLCYSHIDRKDYRDKKIFNCAADYMVNGELIASKIGKMPVDKKGAMIGLYDSKYKGWFTEKVYDDLLKNKDNQNMQMAGSGDDILDKLLDKLLDEHLDGENNSEEGSEPTKEGSEPTKDGPAKLTKDERDQLKAELKDQIINAAKTCDAGKLPGGIKRIIQELTEPKMDWRSLLQCQLDSIIPADYSFSRMSRKGWDFPARLPGVITDKMLDVVVAIDQSGSIDTKQARDFLSEVNGIMGQFTNYKILVFCFDTKVYNPQEFTSDNGEDIRTYQPMGKGGTSFSCIFDYLKEESITPEKLVIFTDGYCNEFGDKDYCDTVWIVKGSNIVPPFGAYAKLE